MAKAIAILSDQHWHSLRAEHLGGSEIAALFGEHDFLTKFELWQRKAGKIPEPDLSDNDRVFWGSILEPAVAQGVASKTGWTVRKVHRYLSAKPEIGLGGTLDYEIVSNDKGPGVLEIKTTDWLVTRNWHENEPPLAYQLQIMAYLALTGRSWGCMAVLVGGNDLRLFQYERRPTTIATIENEVKSFWQSIADNKPPKPNWEEDGETISRLYSQAAQDTSIDISESNRAHELIATYKLAADVEKKAKESKEAAKAELLPMIGTAHRAYCGDFTISAGVVAATHISYDRKEYRDFRINEKKKKK